MFDFFVLWYYLRREMDGMLIAFYSMTGNVRRFVNGADIGDQFELYEIKADNQNEKVTEPYILVTSTYGFGGVPAPVERFLDVNHKGMRSEEHMSELQSRGHLVCRLLLEKKKKKAQKDTYTDKIYQASKKIKKTYKSQDR